MKENLSRITGTLLVFCLLFMSVSCGTQGSGTVFRSSEDLSLSSVEGTDGRNQDNTAISLDRFELEINNEKLGVVNKTDGKDGYDAALVTAEDGTNYIYMYLPDEKMAKSVLTDSDGDQEADPGLKLISRKNGYELYIQESAAADSSDSDFPMYGKCLLAGRMIIIVNGTQDNKKQIIENADRFLKNLGFNP